MKKAFYPTIIASIIALPLHANQPIIEKAPVLKATVTNKTKQPQIVSVINANLKGEANKTQYVPINTQVETQIPLSPKIGLITLPNRLVVSSGAGGAHSFYLRTWPNDPNVFGSPNLPLPLYHSWYDQQGTKHIKQIPSNILKKDISKYYAHITINKDGKVTTKINQSPVG